MRRKIKSPQRLPGILPTIVMVMVLVPALVTTVGAKLNINFHVSTNDVCTRGQMVTFIYRLPVK